MKLQVGVIGLGRRWRERYKPALLSLRGRFTIRVLCDQVHRRARKEARQLGCDAVTGPAALLENPEVQAVLLLDAQWYGLWPLELACRAGKPVFCAVTIEQDATHAEAVSRRVRESGLPVMMGLTPRLMPASLRLRELLEKHLGLPRLLLCDHMWPARRGAGMRERSFARSVGSGLIDWCTGLLSGAPVKVSATTAGDLTSLLLDYGDGRAIQIRRFRSSVSQGSCRLQVVAAKGSACLELPRLIRWNDAEGRHALRLPMPIPLERLLLERFHAAIVSGREWTPSWEEAFPAFQILAGAGSAAGW